MRQYLLVNSLMNKLQKYGYLYFEKIEFVINGLGVTEVADS